MLLTKEKDGSDGLVSDRKKKKVEKKNLKHDELESLVKDNRTKKKEETIEGRKGK